jgi:hypothetical protein
VEEAMTEDEWLACDDPDRMLWSISGRPSARKLWANRKGPSARKWRLLGVACCRRIWFRITEAECRRVVEVVELYVDGAVDAEELRTVANAAVECGFRVHHDARLHRAYAATDALGRGVGLGATLEHSCSCTVGHAAWAIGEDRENEMRIQSGLIRDIFGNPFRPVEFDPAWRTSDVLLLAQGIYDEKAFDRMPIMADALQDAGCNSDDILTHLRDPDATHVRGCWALDLVLEKT